MVLILYPDHLHDNRLDILSDATSTHELQLPYRIQNELEVSPPLKLAFLEEEGGDTFCENQFQGTASFYINKFNS